jgi:diphthine synthase
MDSATTHADLIIRAKELSIPIQTIHNASIMNAVGACGLQLYNFGQTISIPFFTDNWRPDSFYDRIKENRNLGLHTLCLLDIKVKEQSIENLARYLSPYIKLSFLSYSNIFLIQR